MRHTFEKVIKGGTIVDGMRTPRYVSDIGIRDGRIAYVGDIECSGKTQVIDAHGLIVAPGFIDLHTHYDSQVFWDPYCTISGWHGVTSVVIGNCGFGFAPCRPAERDRAMLIMSRNEAVPLKTMKAGMPWDWVTFPEFLESLERTPKGVNILSYVPLSPLLMYVMGMDSAKSRPATESERAELRRLFNEALDAGACGFSAQHTGPDNVQRDYDGSPMITDVMARRDLMLFAEVLRERSEGFIQVACAPDVAEELAAVSGRPVIWNALVPQVDQHGAKGLGHQQVIQWLNEANARGRRVFAQALTCSVGFMFTMEEWNLFDSSPLWRDATLGSPSDRLRKLSDPAVREALRNEHDAGKGPAAGGELANENTLQFVGIDGIFIIGPQSEKYLPFLGNTVGEYARKVGKHTVDAFLDMVIDEKLQTEFQTPEIKVDNSAMRDVVQSPLALPGLSDGGAHTKFITNATYGTDYIIDYVRKGKVISLEEAHWRLSCYSAQAAGLRDRGVLRELSPADILIYDFDELSTGPIETAHDFPANEWRRVRKADGYRYIMVNGEFTFIDGKCTGATPGHLLRHGYDSRTEASSMSV
jgi:N-acyl-D-amino-acid deacylase